MVRQLCCVLGWPQPVGWSRRGLEVCTGSKLKPEPGPYPRSSDPTRPDPSGAVKFRARTRPEITTPRYVCACIYESSEASAYSFGLATNPNPTRARSYPLNINPKPDPKPESISGPAGSGRGPWTPAQPWAPVIITPLATALRVCTFLYLWGKVNLSMVVCIAPRLTLPNRSSSCSSSWTRSQIQS